MRAVADTYLACNAATHGQHHGHAAGQGTGTGTGTGSKSSSNTKGAEYDATGGAVDDRSFLQKAKDKLTPGSDVRKHTKA